MLRNLLRMSVYIVHMAADSSLLQHAEAMANEGFKLSKGISSNSHVSTGSFFKSRDEYRKHPILNGHLKRATPGLGIALGLFGVYLIVDGISSRVSAPKKEHH